MTRPMDVRMQRETSIFTRLHLFPPTIPPFNSPFKYFLNSRKILDKISCVSELWQSNWREQQVHQAC